jgi:hypothetical protein
MRSMNPFDNFKIGGGKVTVTETGRRMAGESVNSIDATGALMTGMVVRVVNRLDENFGDNVGSKNEFVYGVMQETAQNAIPPLTPDNQELFLVGARSALGLQGGNQ